ncbi:MAG: hypothetical protein IH618_07995 [Ignavibacteriaceae bacterium]|nr:hypothetical protein [Ignavibacteriaceae bacterium]
MGLPEKQYFSTDEIAIRWGCEADLLFHYFEMGILHPAVIFKTMKCELWEGEEPGNTNTSKLIAPYFITDKPLYILSYNKIVSVYNDEYEEEIHLNGHIFVFDLDNPHQWVTVPRDNTTTYVINDNDFIITKQERDRFEKEFDLKIQGNNKEATNLPEFEYVDNTRIEELKSLANNLKYDLTKLLRLIEELNHNWKNANYFSTAMLVRAIMDHIPPIFECKNFNGICNNYKGSKSFKEATQNLQSSLRKIADGHLHSSISSKEILPNRTQVNFSNTLDLLLAELLKILSNVKV